MAEPFDLSSYPILTTEVLRQTLGPVASKMNQTKSEKMLQNRWKKKKTSMTDLAPTAVRELRQFGNKDITMDIANLISMQRSKGCRGLNQNNVTNISNLLVANSFGKEFPLLLGVMTIDDDSSGQQVRTRIYILYGSV